MFVNLLYLAACKTKFKKLYSSKKGLFVNCENVGGGKHFSLEECYSAACAIADASAFNFNNGKCYIKRCTDNKLVITNKYRGYSVYSSVTPVEEVEPAVTEGIPGRFLPIVLLTFLVEIITYIGMTTCIENVHYGVSSIHE